MRRIMQRFQTAATFSLMLIVCLLLLAGCSWTSRQLGMSDSPSENPQSPDQATKTFPTDANAADKRALLRLNFGVPGPIHIVSKKQGPIRKQASYTTPPRKPHAERTKSAKNTMVVTRTPPKTPEPEAPAPQKPVKQPEPEKTAATPAPPQPAAQNELPAATTPAATARQDKSSVIDPNGPQPPQKLHTSVPFQHADKKPQTPAKQQPEDRGDIVYPTTKALRQAVDKAVEQKSFLGYTDPFDAFPALEGNDTMSAAFIPVDHPNHKVFYHAFYAPDKNFNRRVYGYTVIDMLTKKDYGHFDGNADGKFEQKTLHPSVVFEDYARTSKSQFGEKMPEVQMDKKKKQ